MWKGYGKGRTSIHKKSDSTKRGKNGSEKRWCVMRIVLINAVKIAAARLGGGWGRSTAIPK